jgi:hypothetical protein
MKRSQALAWMRVAGYHADRWAFTRLLVEERVSRAAGEAAWKQGTEAKRNGVACKCRRCVPGSDVPTFPQEV